MNKNVAEIGIFALNLNNGARISVYIKDFSVYIKDYTFFQSSAVSETIRIITFYQMEKYFWCLFFPEY